MSDENDMPEQQVVTIGLPVTLTLIDGMLLVDVDLCDVGDALGKDEGYDQEEIAPFEEAVADRNVFLRYSRRRCPPW